MHVFLSYSAADRKLAERLREELSRQGFPVWTGTQGSAGTEGKRQIEEAIRSADDILVLVGSRSRDDAAQQLTWRVALESVWKDSRKRLIPVLLRDAALPPFVFGDAAGDETRVVRILDPRDVHGAVRAILMALQRNGQGRETSKAGESGSVSYPIEGEGDLGSVEVSTKGTQSYAVEAERNDRLLELEKFAEHLKE